MRREKTGDKCCHFVHFSDFFSCSWLPRRFTRIFGSHPSLACEREFDNCFDKFAIKVVRDGETVGHLPREFSKIAWYRFRLYFGVLGMIHGKLQIFFQMFSQISRTPDFERSFRVKRCGLYAGVYGISIFLLVATRQGEINLFV